MGSGAAQVRAATTRSRAEVYNHRPSVDFTREGPTAAARALDQERQRADGHQRSHPADRGGLLALCGGGARYWIRCI